MLSGGWCRPLHQISGSDSARLGIVWERGRRLRASSACHPCPCRDRARILTADLRCHHSRKIRRGEKVQKGTCPSPLFFTIIPRCLGSWETTPKVSQKRVQLAG